MKIHFPLAEAVISNLHLIFEEGRYADRVIEHCFKKNKKWGARDRRFIAENTYDIVRNYRLLAECAGSKQPWMLLAAHWIKNGIQLPDWKELNGINPSYIVNKLKDTELTFAIKESVPDWMCELGKVELPEIWETEMTALNKEAHVVLRTNTLKITRKKLQEALLKEEISTFESDEMPEALILEKRQSVFSSQAFKNGFFEIQDIASQHVAQFTDIKPGQRVIDACAGGGGKSLHLAALMQNKGKIISMDVEEWKLNELKRRAARAGVQNIETRLIGSNTVQGQKNSADRLLLDVPCSGTGVLKRNPDAKWKLTPEIGRAHV